MRVAEIFSFGRGSCGHDNHRSYSGSEWRHRDGDYYRSSYYGSRNGDHYERHHSRGILGIIGGN
jgi:hypothetical protein